MIQIGAGGQHMMGGGGMMGGGWTGAGDMMGAWGGGFFGATFMIFLWVLVIAATVWTVLALVQAVRRPAERSSALAILDQRLASGEIGPEEYRSRRSLIATGR